MDDLVGISRALERNNTQVQMLQSSLEGLSGKFDRIGDLFSKMRMHTKDEIQELMTFRDVLKQVAEGFKKAFPGKFDGMDDFSVAIAGLEDKLENTVGTLGKVQAAIKNLNAEMAKSSANRAGMESKLEEISGKSGKKSQIENLLSGKMDAEKKKKLQEVLGIEGKFSSSYMRRAGQSALKGIDADLKNTSSLKSGIELEEKRLKILEEQEEVLRKQRKTLEEERKETEKMLGKTQELHKVGKTRAKEDREERYRSGGFQRALGVASDLNLPGVSQAAMIGKYASAGRSAIGGMVEGGSAGMGALGLGLGAMAGAGVVAGGYTALQGYKAYGMAQQMAEPRIQLNGLVGNRGIGQVQNLSTSREMERLGYAAPENLGAMIQSTRALGGQAGLSQLGGLSKTSRMFGLDRGEAIGMAGGLMQAGATPDKAAETLKSVMIEGVQAGIDRARITGFTEQVVGIQEEVLKISGQNKISDISKTLGSLFAASKSKDFATFMRGPEMSAVKSLDHAMKSAGSGGGGMSAGALYRFAQKQTGGGGKMGFDESYYNTSKYLQGGLFGGEGKDGALGKIKGITSQFLDESGYNQAGTAEDKKKAKQRAVLKMGDMGINISQGEKMLELVENVKEGKISQKDANKKLQELKEEMKDPLVRMKELMASSVNLTAKLANDITPEILAVETKMLGLQQLAANAMGVSAKQIGELFGVRSETPEQKDKREAAESPLYGGNAKSMDEYYGAAGGANPSEAAGADALGGLLKKGLDWLMSAKDTTPKKEETTSSSVVSGGSGKMTSEDAINNIKILHEESKKTNKYLERIAVGTEAKRYMPKQGNVQTSVRGK